MWVSFVSIGLICLITLICVGYLLYQQAMDLVNGRTFLEDEQETRYNLGSARCNMRRVFGCTHPALWLMPWIGTPKPIPHSESRVVNKEYLVFMEKYGRAPTPPYESGGVVVKELLPFSDPMELAELREDEAKKSASGATGSLHKRKNAKKPMTK